MFEGYKLHPRFLQMEVCANIMLFDGGKERITKVYSVMGQIFILASGSDGLHVRRRSVQIPSGEIEFHV